MNPDIKKKISRQNWMDALRGLAILLVVHYHVVGAINSNDMIIESDFFKIFSQITYLVSPIRMPVLIFLSGLLVAYSVNKGGKKYFSGKLKNLIYPFILWTCAYVVLDYMHHYFFDGARDYILWKALTFEPIQHLWFLNYLIAYYIFAYFLSSRIALYLALSIFIMLFFFDGDWQARRFPSLLILFLLGRYIGENLSSFLLKIRGIDFSQLFVVLVCVAITFNFYNGYVEQHYDIPYILLGILLIPVLIKIMMLLEGVGPFKVFEFLGRDSLIIYLIHVPLISLIIKLIGNLDVFKNNAFNTYTIIIVLVMFVSISFIYLRRNIKAIDLLFSAELAVKYCTRLFSSIPNREILKR